MNNLTLKTKLFISNIIPVLISGITLIGILLYSIYNSTNFLMDQSGDLALDQFVTETRNHLLLGDIKSLEKSIKKLADKEYIASVLLTDLEDRKVYAQENPIYENRQYSAPFFFRSIETVKYAEVRTQPFQLDDSSPLISSTVNGVPDTGRKLAAIKIDLNLKPFIEHTSKELKWIILIIVITIITISIITLINGRVLINPIRNLTNRATLIEKGKYNHSLNLKENHRQIEFSTLGKAFDNMTESLISNEMTMREKIDNALKKQGQAVQAKSEFLTNISHDLRTPIHSIQVTTDLIKNTGELSHEQKEYLSILNSSTELLTGVINNVLDAAKIDSGNLTINEIEFNLYELILRIRSALLARTLSDSVKLHISIMPGTPEQLIGDPIRISQVLLNILSNSFKFTEHGFVSLSVEALKSVSSKTIIRFEIKDTGHGMENGEIEKIFKRYFTNNKEKSNLSGTGLGLSISHELVKMMGGHIFAESDYGQGSTFFIDTPLKNVSPNKVPVTKAPIHRLIILGEKDILDNDISSNQAIRKTYVSSPDELLSSLSTIEINTNKTLLLIIDGNKIDPGKLESSLFDFKDIGLPIIVKFNRLEEIAKAYWQKDLFDGMTESKVALQLLEHTLHVYNLFNTSLVVTNSNAIPLTDKNLLKKKILLAEDNWVNAQLMEKLLVNAGHTVETVNTGTKALQHALIKIYDVLILDQQMPGYYGTEVVKLIRKSESNYPAKIIILSADINLKTDIKVKVDKVIAKPVSKNEILNDIQELFEEVNIIDEIFLARLIDDVNDNNFILNTVSEFKMECLTTIQKVIEKISNNDMKAAVKRLHNNKGSALNLGAAKYSRELQRLIDLISNDKVHPGDNLHIIQSQLNEILDITLSKISIFFKARA